MTIRIICNKCSEEFDDFLYCTISIRDSEAEDYGAGTPDIHLCDCCTVKLTNWLKGEPLPKQTTT